MHLFYTPDIKGNTYQLNEQESKHCIRVLRLKAGDNVNMVDGRGGFYEAIILTDDPKRCLLSVKDHVQKDSDFPYYLHIGIAPTKNLDRTEWFLEKATEIGINEITPLICERSERKNLRTDRLEKVIIAAMKQSLKCFLPVINEPLPFKKWVKLKGEGFRGIAHCMEGEKQKLWQINPLSKVTIAIGPEGDFSPDELKIALKNGFTPLDLGDARLRTETAGIAVVHGIRMLNAMNE